MSSTPQRQPLQERVATVIKEAAAAVLAVRPEAGMVDVAVEAGVARATVYRYFPTRGALLDELLADARARAADALDTARIAEMDAPRAVDRAVRALLELGPAFVVLMRAGGGEGDAVAERLRRMIRRGQGAGDIRDDVPDAWLTASLVGLILSVQGGAGTLGRDDTVAAVASLFLEGAHADGRGDAGSLRHSPTPLRDQRG
jgi:TetR/AcrR family transcriptional regulator, mexCD-oprJ operon repressor